VVAALQDDSEWRILANAGELHTVAHVLELPVHLKRSTEVAEGHTAAVVKYTAL